MQGSVYLRYFSIGAISAGAAADPELLFAVKALAAMSSARPKVNALNSPGFCLPTISPVCSSVVLVLFLFLAIEASLNRRRA